MRVPVDAVLKMFIVLPLSNQRPPERQKKHHPGSPDGGFAARNTPFPSGAFLRGRLLRPEVVVIGHARADLGIELPPHRAFGKFFL